MGFWGMRSSWLSERLTWRAGAWAVWIVASSPVTTQIARRGPIGLLAALLIAVAPAWISRVMALSERIEDSVDRRNDGDLHDWERAMLGHLDEASEIASSNLGSSSSRRELRSAISHARRTLAEPEPRQGLGDDMDRVAVLLDRLVEESSATRRRDEAADDLRGAIEALGVQPTLPEELRLRE